MFCLYMWAPGLKRLNWYQRDKSGDNHEKLQKKNELKAKYSCLNWECWRVNYSEGSCGKVSHDTIN